jgi:hypothetical protein
MSNPPHNWKEIATRLQAEQMLRVSQAARLVPSHGRRGYCSANALVAWIVKGKRGIFLDGVRAAGKTWWTSAEALARFLAALSEQEAQRRTGAARIAVPVASPASMRRRAAEAMERIRELRGRKAAG